jgi:cyclophilin family peptidyl-prolyl cis-trans isomerase
MSRIYRTLRWTLAASMLVVLAVALTGCGGGVKSEVAVIETDMGQVIVEFYPDVAPNHVARFKELAREGFYDGVQFHRVIPGFVVQTGDPKTKQGAGYQRMEYGSGGSGKTLDAEFSDVKLKRGTLAMARSQDPNSADSQFYFALEAQSHLDGKYTVFGEVVRGMEVIDRVAAVETDARDIPVEPVYIQSVKIMKRKEAGLED